MNLFKMKYLNVIPGTVLSVAIAVVACFLESLLPIHVVGAAVIAMFLGMILNGALKKTKVFAPGLKFTSKKLLKFYLKHLMLRHKIVSLLEIIFIF